MNNSAPVLFLVFNRIEEAKCVFKQIKEAKPRRLYIAGDGPRADTSSEDIQIQYLREYFLKNISWDCKVRTLFRNNNLGCKQAVSKAIDWFFDNEDSGIILEDDCYPSLSFFRYCTELLDRYRNEPRIMKISGFNIVDNQHMSKNSYLFSRYSFNWGWATWKRAWCLFDIKMKDWPILKKRLPDSMPFYKKRKQVLEETFQGKINTWDYQWGYSIAYHKGFHIIPAKSMISNIGFGISATHTKSAVGRRAMVEAREIKWPLKHQKKIVLDTHYEKVFLRYMNSELKENLVAKIWRKILKPIKSEVLRIMQLHDNIRVFSQKQLPKISICTAVWGGFDFTKRFIESVMRNQSFEYELVIVDNGSESKTAHYIKAKAERYFRFEENQGFCKGFNKAAELATCDYLMLINCDTVLPNENWWQELHKESVTLKNCGLIFPCVNNILSPVNKRSEKGSGVIRLKKWELPLASGCALIVRKDIFKKVGGFDDSYGSSGEDLDFQFKIWDAGYDIYVTEKVFIEHIGKGTSRRLLNQKELWAENFKKFKKKWEHRIKINQNN